MPSGSLSKTMLPLVPGNAAWTGCRAVRSTRMLAATATADAAARSLRLLIFAIWTLPPLLSLFWVVRTHPYYAVATTNQPRTLPTHHPHNQERVIRWRRNSPRMPVTGRVDREPGRAHAPWLWFWDG